MESGQDRIKSLLLGRGLVKRFDYIAAKAFTRIRAANGKPVKQLMEMAILFVAEP